MLTHGIPPHFRGGAHLFIYNRHTPSVQSRVYRVTQLRTDGVHCRESAGTGPVFLKVVPVTSAACVSLFSHTHCWYEVVIACAVHKVSEHVVLIPLVSSTDVLLLYTTALSVHGRCDHHPPPQFPGCSEHAIIINSTASSVHSTILLVCTILGT